MSSRGAEGEPGTQDHRLPDGPTAFPSAESESLDPGLSLRSPRDDKARFTGLEIAQSLVLAVSGGPDSMALMWLAVRWAEQLGAGAPRLHVATVDHGLRPEAAQEAALVTTIAADLGLSCATLAWTGPKPATRIQELARQARYALLVDHARSVGAAAILTAHHADDQAETVLMRLTRGSGLSGLAGMRRETEIAPGIRLVRPLLGLPKGDLLALCRRQGIRFAEDPSNVAPAYARARLRAQAEALDRIGLDRATLLRLAQRMSRAEAALEAEVDRLEHGLHPLREPGRYRVCLSAASRVAPEILLRLLRRAIEHVVASERPIRLDRLEAAADAVQAAAWGGGVHRTTLAGARIVLGRDTMLDVTLAPPRRRGQPRPEGKALAAPRLRPI